MIECGEVNFVTDLSQYNPIVFREAMEQVENFGIADLISVYSCKFKGQKGEGRAFLHENKQAYPFG